MLSRLRIRRYTPRQTSSALLLVVLSGALAVIPHRLQAVDWSTVFGAPEVRDYLSTPEGRTKALEFCRKMGISKVYIETFRDGYQADPQALKTARDFFRQAGLKVSGCVATTRLGKRSTGWDIIACYTDRANRERLAAVFRSAAEIFDEIIIDDFLFTDCECSECAAAKGAMSWRQYREKLMLQVSRENVLEPARQANPNVKIILKYPQWYDKFQERGYSVVQETALYDRIWVGTETRDPSSDELGHPQQYEGFFIYRWLADVGGKKTGGGWFDPYRTDAALYLDQAYVSVLAGSPEIVLFHYGALAHDFPAQAEAFVARGPELEALAKLVGRWGGIPAYKPPSSEPGNEEYIFDRIGMLAIPLLPVASFPEKARAALFTVHSLEDTEFVPKLANFLKGGGTAFISEGLNHRLTGDPRLPPIDSLLVEKGKDLVIARAGGGRLVIFSDALLRLTYVDAQRKTQPLTPELREALEVLRKVVAEFTTTSLDAPPRVAVFPLGGRVAVVNFTELPVTCQLAEPKVTAQKYRKALATPGGLVADDGVTLHLSPHGVLLVEQ